MVKILDIKFIVDLPANGNFDAIYTAYVQAFSTWIEQTYPLIIANTPVYSGTDPRAQRGFLRSFIKLIWSALPDGTKYRTLGVPGASNFGSAAYHARSAIMSLHYGWAAPFLRRASNKKVMSFPVKGGQVINRGSGYVYTRTAFQVKNQIRNQWIVDTLSRNYSVLDEIYKSNLNKENKRRKKVEIVRH